MANYSFRSLCHISGDHKAMANKRPPPLLRYSSQTQYRCIRTGAPLPFDQNHHHTALTILSCPYLPFLLLRSLPPSVPDLASPMVGNVVMMYLEDHTTSITIPVPPPGNVLFPCLRLHRSVRRRSPDPDPDPNRLNLLLPVGFMPMFRYRTDGRNVALLKEGHTSWIIT